MTVEILPGMGTRPETVYAERQLLGCCLNGYKHLNELEVNAADFDNPHHALIWAAISRVTEAGQRASAESVRFALGAELSDPMILIDLSTQASPAVQAPYWAKQVTSASDLRALDLVGYRVREIAKGDVSDADAAIEMARALIDKAPRHTKATGTTWADVEPRVIDRIQNGQQRGMHTPWPDLTKTLHGLQAGRMYLVGARPGEGKSLFLQNLGTHFARHHGQVLIASLEMSDEEYGMRMLSDAAEVSSDRLQEGDLSESEWARLAQGRNRLAAIRDRLTILDNEDASLAQIESAARDLHRSGDLVMIGVDYLQLVKPANSKDPRQEQVSRISRGLKKLGRSLSVPVVALSQLNRASVQRTDKKPTLADFRESGAQEQDTDVAILQWLDGETGELGLWVAKNRWGKRPEFSWELHGHYSRIVQPDHPRGGAA